MLSSTQYATATIYTFFSIEYQPCTSINPAASHETLLNYFTIALFINMYSYKYYVDSWIEISSQPSSSSLSSNATSDDIVTTGLHVQSDAQHHRRRRRRLQHLATAAAANINYSHRVPSGEGSSQDEYEESESESDQVLSSSNEDISSRPRENVLMLQTHSVESASETTFSSDEDDTSTALAFNQNAPSFTPQPNAFSHPPTSSQGQAYSRATDPSNRSYIPASHSRLSATRTTTRRSSQSSEHTSRHRRQHQQQQQHSPYSMISPSHQADHDAALRASLSTLLSCAAAARGLPKNDSQPATSRNNAENRVEPSSFRLIPGSVAMDEDSGGEQKSGYPPTTTDGASPSRGASSAVPRHITRQHKQTLSDRSTNSPSPTNTNAAQKAKRKASSSKDRSTANPATSPSSKKSRRATLGDSTAVVSPTLMTWVLSAGVVVLFSAISFSSGYALGRQVGRTEAGNGIGMRSFGVNGGNGSGGVNGLAGNDCGSEAVKGGLRRLRWGAAAAGSSVSV